MFQEPDDIDRAQLAAFVSRTWNLDIPSIAYKAVGFGTHHYTGTDTSGGAWFVNVDELEPEPGATVEEEFDNVDRALRTALRLNKAGLEFVHAPTESTANQVTRRYDEDDDYAVSLYAFVDGVSADWGPYRDNDERRRVLTAVGRIHAATDQVPQDLPWRDDLEVDARALFFRALEELPTTWSGGPFSEPTRKLLSKNEQPIRARFDAYDDLKSKISRDDWVVTHGEPHAANIIRTGKESFVLIDWDTVAIGPRERDLWMLQPKDGDWSDYATSGTTEVDPLAIELFDLRWTLTEISLYTAWFREPHVDDADTRRAWTGFEEYVAMARLADS